MLGFTLVELMITISIIAILAAISIPIYFNHITRTKITAQLALTSGAKTEIGIKTLSSNTIASNDIHGITGITDLPENIAVATNGTITINVGEIDFNSTKAMINPIKNSLAGLTLTPNLNNGLITSTCSNALESTITEPELPSSYLFNNTPEPTILRAVLLKFRPYYLP